MPAGHLATEFTGFRRAVYSHFLTFKIICAMKKCIKTFQDLALPASQQKAIKGGSDSDTIIGTATSDFIGTADTIDG